MTSVRVGVDVGGTNTDAVVLDGKQVVSSAKSPTTADVTTGMCESVWHALKTAHHNLGSLKVVRIHIGTTHFVNAVVERRHLERVAVIRLCGSASTALPPYSDFPDDLREVIFGGAYMIDGGHQFDGNTEIAQIRTDQLQDVVEKLQQSGIEHVVVASIFSPVNQDHELRAAELLKQMLPSVSLTLSHSIGQLGLLQRENAAILNESLRSLSRRTVEAFRAALGRLGLDCPFFLTQNDGTLISADQAMELPVHTFASGPTNSMRGATFLSNVTDAVVVDIGGTSTDAGIIAKGFPREAGSICKVGGVNTNFRMPDVLSIGLGGGSIVKYSQEEPGSYKIQVGPQSVGYRLEKEALVFGGSTLTATDIAAAAGLADIGERDKVQLPPELIQDVKRKIHTTLEEVIDQVKITASGIPVVLVGGGSILIDDSAPIKGITEMLKPQHFEVANAVGAALSQVAGTVDHVIQLEGKTREAAIQEAKKAAFEAAANAGADPGTIKVLDIMEVPLAYLPGNATRVKVKAVGDLLTNPDEEGTLWTPVTQLPAQDLTGVDQVRSSTGGSLDGGADDPLLIALEETPPSVDKESGLWTLSHWDIECIAVGAGILGCGGGGSPEIGRLRAHRALREGKEIKVMTPERMVKRMAPTDRVLPIAFMGAPTIAIERIKNGFEGVYCLKAIQDLYSKGGYDESTGTLSNKDGAIGLHEKPDIAYIDDYRPPSDGGAATTGLRMVGVFSAEIGGSNGIEQLLLGAYAGLPVLDCDCMGRAFPELQMSTDMIYGLPPFPAVLTDYTGRSAVVLKVATAKGLEDHFRGVCIEMGCGALLIQRGLEKDDIAPMTVAHSVSRAWRLGNAVISARKQKSCPVSAILEHEGARLLIAGKVTDVQRKTTGGFARGQLIIEGLGEHDGEKFQVLFQNENLVAQRISPEGTTQVVACTPDLLTLVISTTGQPVATEEVRYGLRVSLLALPASPRLTTPRAMEVLGPKAFGYKEEEVTYVPIGNYIPHPPLPPI